MEHTLQHACFTCRKVFKKTVPGKNGEHHRDCYILGMTKTISFRCPECEGPLHAMGKNFRAPRSSRAEQWRVIELLFQAGFRFLSGRAAHPELPTRLRDVEQFIRENSVPKMSGSEPTECPASSRLDEELETLLLSRFKFPVEILTLRRFKTAAGQTAYEFEPFLADLTGPPTESQAHIAGAGEVDPSELDTVVVPAQEQGFKETFLGENRWYQIRIHSSVVPRIKYIAAYQSAPVSAITHVASVKDIVPWKEGPQYVLNFTEPAKEIGPLKLVPRPNGIIKAPQAPRYTSYARLMKAANLDEVF